MDSERPRRRPVHGFLTPRKPTATATAISEKCEPRSGLPSPPLNAPLDTGFLGHRETLAGEKPQELWVELPVTLEPK